jgi:glycosyltransferase involved in cell wall biosynthesis
MTSALPIVSTDVGDVRTIVSRENRPYIVARDDEGALASAISNLAKDAALRATLATANRILACSQYDEDTMFARYRQLYGSAMKRADFARQS